MHRNRTWRTCVVGLTVALLLALPAVVSAQTVDIAAALGEIGISNAQVTAGGDGSITVAYSLTVAGLGPWESFLYQTANIMAVVRDHRDDDVTVVLQITYDDGNMMQITGNTAMATAFLEGRLSPDDYDAALIFTPLTRGPAITGTLCEPAQGRSCATSDACACYPNEACDPGAASADVRGCVVKSEPANAHVVGEQYVCDEGYVWNSDLTACEVPLTCPDGTTPFNGSCIAEAAGRTTGAGANAGDRTGALRLIAIICGAGLCLLVPVAIVVILVSRRKKRQPAPATAPPPPSRPEPFLDLERRYTDLNRAHTEGRLDAAGLRQAQQQLVTQDDRGYWSFSAGRWLWFDGARWIPRDP